MNLTLFFRLICFSIFKSGAFTLTKSIYNGQNPGYNNMHFLCPKVYAKDGFNVSLQINHGNYCTSENGYRKLGHTWQEVEFGFPSSADEEFKPYAEEPNNITGTVGSIPVSVLEQIFEKHGGIDWEKTISPELIS